VRGWLFAYLMLYESADFGEADGQFVGVTVTHAAFFFV
jgi:hypothetical protein